jgi:hypothetical protein
LLRGGDFLEALPVSLDELERFVEPILEVIGAPLLRELVLEPARNDERVDRVDDGFSGGNREAAERW